MKSREVFSLLNIDVNLELNPTPSDMRVCPGSVIFTIQVTFSNRSATEVAQDS